MEQQWITLKICTMVTPICNLVAFNSKYSKTGDLWFYSKYEATNFDANIADANDFKSFKYKTKLRGGTGAAYGILKTQQLLHH